MARSRDLVLAALADHKPKRLRDVLEVTGLSQGAAYNVLADVGERDLCSTPRNLSTSLSAGSRGGLVSAKPVDPITFICCNLREGTIYA